MPAMARGVSAPAISRRTRLCRGGSLNTRLVVWCSYSGVSPNFGRNSTALSLLNAWVSRYTRDRSACRVRNTLPSGMRLTGACFCKAW